MDFNVLKFPLQLNLWGLTKMIDTILKDLWAVKDNIAREHNYDLDKLVAYLQIKSDSCVGETLRCGQEKETDQSHHAQYKHRRILAT